MQLFYQILSMFYVRNNVYLSINADVGRYFKMYKKVGIFRNFQLNSSLPWSLFCQSD